MSLPFNLKQLRILKAVALEKNFTKAAKILAISQPTLSKQIKSLETSLKTILIYRNNKVILLTFAGKTFLQYAERILAICEECHRNINRLKFNYKRTKTVGANIINSNFLIPRIIITLISISPIFQIKLSVNSTDTLKQKIFDKKIEVSLINEKIIKPKKQIRKIRTLFNEYHLLLYTKNNLIKNLNRIEKKQINLIKLKQIKIMKKYHKNKKTIMLTNSTESQNKGKALGIGFYEKFDKKTLYNSKATKIKRELFVNYITKVM